LIWIWIWIWIWIFFGLILVPGTEKVSSQIEPAYRPNVPKPGFTFYEFSKNVFTTKRVGAFLAVWPPAINAHLVQEEDTFPEETWYCSDQDNKLDVRLFTGRPLQTPEDPDKLQFGLVVEEYTTKFSI
jgi:hypothetical protein